MFLRLFFFSFHYFSRWYLSSLSTREFCLTYQIITLTFYITLYDKCDIQGRGWGGRGGGGVCRDTFPSIDLVRWEPSVVVLARSWLWAFGRLIRACLFIKPSLIVHHITTCEREIWKVYLKELIEGLTRNCAKWLKKVLH